MKMTARLLTTLLAGSMAALASAQDAQSGATEDTAAARDTAAGQVDASAPATETTTAAADAINAKGKSSSDIVLAAQAAGYKIVNKNGVQLFCKKEDITGSRLRTRTRCLTADELEQERTAAKDALMEYSRKVQNPVGD